MVKNPIDKEIAIEKKIKSLRKKIINLLKDEREELINLSGSQKGAIFIWLAVTATTYIRVVASSIHLGLFDKEELLENLSKDFLKEVDRKLELYKKKEMKEF